MLLRTGIAALALTFVATLPAYALYCNDDRSGVVIGFGFQLGADYTETERNNFDLMELQRRGVDATAVERWSGCIRAYVRKPTGGEEMQFYDPNTFERVQ